MINPVYHVVSFAADFDLGSFDCGEAGYNDWLTRHASASVKAGVCTVYLLIERSQDRERVVGYFGYQPHSGRARASAPISIAWLTPPRARLKSGQARGARDLRADKDAQWGASSCARLLRQSSGSPMLVVAR